MPFANYSALVMMTSSGSLNFFTTKNALSVKEGETMTPNGKDLLALLISLYAEQEGVEIKYEIHKGEMKNVD